MRGGIAAQGDEGDVFPAQPLDAPAADDTPGVGTEDDLEQHPGRVGRRAVLVVAVTGGKAAEVDFMFDQMMHRMLETARQQLLCQIHRQEAGAGVDPLVARHAAAPQTRCALEP